ncbi:type II secretion system protein N [Sphingomicrobium nitratireducens]|uniref:type II secretion system protein N n=1 Tax=Sphingomicrobium nitratireducens TaxID=2964666 RepID=UPI00223F6468|nr:type II secretion system protein N [Sphingomicrobium nitratireducens]
MTRRWILWTAGLFLLGLVLFFPLRLALDAASGPTSALSARQVGGSVWAGRIGDVALGDEALGTFDVALSPLPLLIGRFELGATRLEDSNGPLSGRLIVGGGREGVASLSGRMGVARLFAPLPVEALTLEEVDLLFKDGRCAEAKGRIVALPTAGVSAILNGPLDGELACGEDGRALATLSTPRGGHHLLLAATAEGDIEAEIAVEGASPAMAVTLQGAGFVEEGGRYVLRMRPPAR